MRTPCLSIAHREALRRLYAVPYVNQLPRLMSKNPGAPSSPTSLLAGNEALAHDTDAQMGLPQLLPAAVAIRKSCGHRRLDLRAPGYNKDKKQSSHQPP